MHNPPLILTNRCLQSKEDFETSYRYLKRLKSFQGALMSVTNILTEKIANMQDTIIPECMVADYATTGCAERGKGIIG